MALVDHARHVPLRLT